MADTKYIISLVDRVTRVANRIQGSLTKVGTVAQKASQAVDGLGLIAGGVAVAGVFKLGAELESVRLTFNTLTGSVEAGTKLFEDLTEFANTTPFQNDALNKNAKTLLAFGEDASKVEKTLRMLGDIAAGDQHRLNGLTLAFAQSQAAGRLMGQDLLQMVNAGFNPLQTISEATGVSMLELKKRMEKGEISFDLVRQAFEAATAEGGKFHGLTQAMSKTMAGKWSTVMGKAKFLISELGLSMKDVFTPFIDGIIKAIEFVSKYRNIFFPLISVLVTATAVLVGFTAAMKILNVVMMLNPVGAIIAAIAALVAVIIIAWKRSEKFRSVLIGTWEVMKELFNLTYGNLIPVITRLGEIMGSLFNTDGPNRFLTVIKDGVVKYFQYMLSLVGSLAKAVDLLFQGKFNAALVAIGKGVYGLDTTIVDAFSRGAEKAKRAVEESKSGGMFGQTGLGGLSLGLSEEAKKLQAQGVVSGGIKTFNININQLTGVETLSTSTVNESASQTGSAMIRALTEALADIKNVD